MFNKRNAKLLMKKYVILNANNFEIRPAILAMIIPNTNYMKSWAFGQGLLAGLPENIRDLTLAFELKADTLSGNILRIVNNYKIVFALNAETNGDDAFKCYLYYIAKNKMKTITELLGKIKKQLQNC